jgi:hypothetical protein
MSALANAYRNANSTSGHFANCAWGAGADCDCGRHAHAALAFAAWRQEYRDMKAATGATWAEFNDACRAAVTYLCGSGDMTPPATREEHALAWVRAARIVGMGHFPLRA